jgi:hypothetical protein
MTRAAASAAHASMLAVSGSLVTSEATSREILIRTAGPAARL